MKQEKFEAFAVVSFCCQSFLCDVDCPGACVLYDNDRPGQDDLDDDDDRDEGQRDEVEAQGGVAV